MSLRELLALFRKFVEEDILKADALYYATLCWCCGGGRLSFRIKYGDDQKYSQVLNIMRDMKLLNLVTSTDVSEHLVRADYRFLRHFRNYVEEKIENLSEEGVRVMYIIRRFNIHETLTEGDVNTLLYSSIMINNLLRKIIRSIFKARLAIFELVRTGLLVTCLWSPYEGLPHMYRIPHYSIDIWRSI